MLLRFQTLCLAIAFSGCGLFAVADQPLQTQTGSGECDSELTQDDAPILVVAHKRLLDRITNWTDTPAVCLFDQGSLSAGDAKLTTPTLPIAKMLNAKCYIYCPSEELPIEAIYRERLSNHGVKVIAIASPSKRRNQELQKDSLLATLQ